MADPMKKVMPSNHSQAPRNDVQNKDNVQLNRNSSRAKQDSGYSGPQRMGTFDSCNDPASWEEKK